MNKLLSLLLLVSLAANWWLYKQWQQWQQWQMTQNPAGTELSPASIELVTPVQISPAAQPQVPRSPELQSLLETARRAFDDAQHSQATALYTDLLTLDEAAADELLESWLSQIQQLILDKQFDRAENFLQGFLHQYPFHVAVLNLLAQLLQTQGLLMQAIEVYYLIHDNSIEDEHKQNWLQLIHTLVSAHFDTLQFNQAWQQLLDDAENLIYFEPDNGLYLLNAAKALIQLEQIELAKEYLTALQQLPDFKTLADQQLAQLEKAKLGRTGVNLTQHGAHFVVRGRFNRQSSIDLMIDTGASLSVMNTQTFDRISSYNTPTYVQHGTFNTAGGQVDAPVYRFDSFRIGPYRVNNIQFVVMELDGLNKASGLLGMNFLRHFHFQIDQEALKLLLEYR